MAAGTCSGCGEQFAGVSIFDRHQRENYDGEPPFVTCLDPATLGFIKNDKGQWSTGGDPEVNKATYVPAAERPVEEYTVTCRDCGKDFERPRTRGRPPKSCPECRSKR